MKKIVTCLFTLVVMNTAYGQGNFEVGSNVVSAGIGIGNTFGGFAYGTQSPAISLQYERGMWGVGGPGVISLGGYLAFKSFSYNTFGYEASYKYTLIGVRSAYHFNMINTTDWDLYGGAMISYRVVSYSDNDPYLDYTAANDGIYFSIYIGGRYYFSPQWAAFAELGSGIATLSLGAAYKF
jgi:hypothetical protein